MNYSASFVLASAAFCLTAPVQAQFAKPDDTIQAQVSATGRGCKVCHDEFRKDDHHHDNHSHGS